MRHRPRRRTASRACAAIAALAEAMLLAAGLLFATGAGAGDEPVTREHQIKAAYLYNFVKYVEWPKRSFRSADSPIVIGAYCAEAFAVVLGKIVLDRTIGGRRIGVRTLGGAAEARSVHVVYVCQEHDRLWPAIGGAIKGGATLTVADSERSAPDTMIHFVLEGDKVRFGVNVYETGRAGLKVSDQLQKLAVTVRRAP